MRSSQLKGASQLMPVRHHRRILMIVNKYSCIRAVCLSGKFEEQRLIMVSRCNPVQEGELDQGRDVADTEFQHEPAAIGFDTFG
jgi:hypothetical protein